MTECIILDFSKSTVLKTQIPLEDGVDLTQVEEYLTKKGYKLSQIEFMFGDHINYEGF